MAAWGKREELITAYFHPIRGLGFTLGSLGFRAVPKIEAFFWMDLFLFFLGGGGRMKHKGQSSCDMKVQWRKWWQHYIQFFCLTSTYSYLYAIMAVIRFSWTLLPPCLPQKMPEMISGRVPIGSCDFSLYNWSCGEIKEDDWDLKGFSIKRYEDLGVCRFLLGFFGAANFTQKEALPKCPDVFFH